MKKRGWGIIILLVAMLVLLSSYTPHVEAPLSIIGTGQPIILAHRGSRVLAPENTLLAFRNALDFGADVIETDVQLTKDHHLVVFHDDRVDRVTNGSGRVGEFTLAELQTLDAGYKFTHDNGSSFPFRGKGLHISTLKEIFEAFPNAYFNIELKNPDLLAADLLNEAIVANSMQQHVVVGGRWCPSVRHFRTISAHHQIYTSACEGEVISFLVHAFFRTSSVWYSLFPLQAKSLQIPTSSGPFQLDTAIVFSALKKLGKHVHYWVINDPTEMQRLLELGADGIITDRPDIAVKVFESLGLKQKIDRDIYKQENERYFVPVDTHIEVHTCVGVICFVLQNIYTVLPATLVITIIIFALKKQTNKKQKRA